MSPSPTTGKHLPSSHVYRSQKPPSLAFRSSIESTTVEKRCGPRASSISTQKTIWHSVPMLSIFLRVPVESRFHNFPCSTRRPFAPSPAYHASCNTRWAPLDYSVRACPTPARVPRPLRQHRAVAFLHRRHSCMPCQSTRRSGNREARPPWRRAPRTDQPEMQGPK